MWSSRTAARADASEDHVTEPPVVVAAANNDPVRQELTKALAPQYQVLHSESAEAALRTASQKAPCVLVVSAALPDVDALQAASDNTSKNTGARIPAVLMQNDTSAAVHNDVSPRFCSILSYPFTHSQLLTAVRTAAELARLRHKTAALTDIVDHFTESLIFVDADWHISHINTATERELKIQRERLVGEHVWDAFPDAAQSPRAAVYRRCMEERVPVQLEISRPGSGWLQVDAIPLANGGVGVYFRNATRLREAETAVQISTQRLRLFLDHARDYGLILLNIKGEIIEWLGGAETITGWSKQEMVGSSLAPLMTAEDIAIGQAAIELTTAEQNGAAADTRWHQTKSGERFFADGVTIALRGDNGELKGFGKLFRDATSEKLEQEAHRESRKRLQLILDSVADGIFGIAPDRRCIFSNSAAAEILGFTTEEIAHHPFCDLVGRNDEDDPAFAQVNSHFSRALKEGTAVRVDDEVFRHKNGTAVPVDYTINPMVADGKIAGAVVAFSDISARKRTEAALKESKKSLRFVMDSMPQKICIATAQGEGDYFNPRWEQYTGLSREQLRGNGWARMVHADDLEANLKAWSQSVETGKPFQIEHRLRNAEGEYRWHLTRAAPMHDDTGNINFWSASSTDIHAVKSAEADLTQQLRAEQEGSARLIQLARASRSLVSLLSVQQIKVALTEQARSMLNAHQAWVVISLRDDWSETTSAASFSDKYSSCDEEQAGLEVSKALVEVRHLNGPVRLNQQQLQQHDAWRELAGDGSCDMRGLLAVPMVGHGERTLGLVQVSDKGEGEFTAEDEAILSQLAAIAAVGIENALLYDSLKEQDQRKNEFLATLAHELRNPLAPLRTGLDLLKAADADERSTRIRAMMERQLTHMVRLVDDLMDVSRVSRGKVELKREQVDLASVMQTAIETSGPLLRAHNHQVHFQPPKRPMIAHGDPTRLAQVLSNLLNNAAKYTPSGGKVEFFAEQKDARAIIKVKDNGLGLAARTMPRVFDLFTQVDSGTDRSSGGLGIGLSLVKKLVEMHGGQVYVESDGLGKGSTFSVDIPLVDVNQNQQDENPSTINTIPGDTAGRRILVVDDNVEAAETLGMLLELNGHEIRVAHTGSQALQTAEQFPAELIFLDIGLPGMSGYEVAAAIRRNPNLKNIIIVALTGWGSDDDKRRARDAGCDFHLTKPIAAADLNSVMERYFASPQPMF